MWHKIKTHPRYEINKNGQIRHIISKRIKSVYLNDRGYLLVSINIEGKSKPRRVHNLLAQTFIPNPNRYIHVNHIDGNKQNNDLSNLEWTNIKLNNQHAFKKGLINNTGEKNGMSKLKETEVKKIKALLNEGKLSQQKIADIFGVSRSCILGINIGRLWKHV